MKTTRQVDRLQIIVVGPLKTKLFGRTRYFVTTIEEHSGLGLTRFNNRKSETGSAVTELIGEMENLFHQKIKTLMSIHRNIVSWLRSDGGGEYF